MLKYLWLSALVVVLDLASKHLISRSFELYERLEVIPGWFNLTLAHNSGAAFSFLANESGWQRWFFTLIALLVSAIIFLWIKRLQSHERWTAIALALVLGGALGNLWDRLSLGYVVDFIDIYYQSAGKIMHWPAFNIADSAISVGALILIIEALWHKDSTENNNTLEQKD